MTKLEIIRENVKFNVVVIFFSLKLATIQIILLYFEI
jgi:hypothetical protein